VSSTTGPSSPAAVTAPVEGRAAEVLTPEALAFVAALHRRFNRERERLLDARRERQERLDAGERPDFLAETREVREGDWRVAPVPDDLQDRRVEITGPTDRKMVINALNSGARGFMADFEDANSPTWANMIDGQVNLVDAVEGAIEITSGVVTTRRFPGKALQLVDAWRERNREELMTNWQRMERGEAPQRIAPLE
jgi:malate synthase